MLARWTQKWNDRITMADAKKTIGLVLDRIKGKNYDRLINIKNVGLWFITNPEAACADDNKRSDDLQDYTKMDPETSFHIKDVISQEKFLTFSEKKNMGLIPNDN